MSVGPDIVTPLWRGVVLLRIVLAGFAVGAIVVHHDDYTYPRAGLVVLGCIVAWTVFTSIAYSIEVTRRIYTVSADLVVTLLLMGSSAWILSPGQISETAGNTPLLTTVWACGPVLAAAVHAGRIAGMAFGAAVAIMEWWVRGGFDTGTARAAVLLVASGFVVGLAATTARLAAEQVRRAARAEAATAERERLARSIHDGVLQVLSRVGRRGAELGGEAAELARLAGEQEIALRALVSAALPGEHPGGEVDLRPALQLLASPRVDVSVPATPVPLPGSDVDELLAVTREALANTDRHAGAGARSWVLVEDLGEEVVLTVRDDGAGIVGGRLDDAESDGRLGVARSIRGRVADLGGTLGLDTGPDRGTEWEVRLARAPARRKGGGGPVNGAVR